MKLSHAGEQFIKQLETCKLSAYLDTGRVWTIGWGHTGPDVRMGTNWTRTKADATFYLDIAFAEQTINKLVISPLTQNEYDALVSFVYNIGNNAFEASTMLKLLNKRLYVEAAAQFARWNKDNGRVIQGLVNRRAAEEKLFNKVLPCPPSSLPPQPQSLVSWLKSIFSGFFTSR